MDKVSTMGYGLGYIGGSTIPLLIFLIMNLVGVPMLTCLAFVFGLTAVWWLAFSLPLLKNCEQTSGKPYEKGDVARSIKGVGTTIKEIIANKPMLIYILSYFSILTACTPSSAWQPPMAPTWGWIPQA